MRKGSTWCMADGLMTKGNARPLRAPSLGTSGEGEMLEAAGGDTTMLVYTGKSDRDPAGGRRGGTWVVAMHSGTWPPEARSQPSLPLS